MIGDRQSIELANAVASGISVIICCFNSSARIKSTLNHLALQQLPVSISWELIIVDNNCTDDTIVKSKAVWNDIGLDIPLKIVNEPIPGLVHARRKGVETARFEYIVFCDDDNWLADEYLKNVISLFDHNTAYGILGGFNKAVTDGVLPDWFPTYENGYACGKPYATSGDVTKSHFLWGAGMAVRKSMMQKILSPNIPFLNAGRTGNSSISGDDDEICLRAIMLGYKLYYSQDLFLQHFISPHRLTEAYRDELFRNFHSPHKVKLTYKRWIEVQRMSPIKKARSVMYNSFKLFYGILLGKELAKEMSKDYLFFLLHIKFMGNKISEHVLAFYNSNKHFYGR